METKTTLILIVILVIFTMFYCAPKKDKNNSSNDITDNDFIVMSYNVENLFDTVDDPNKEDNEFMPNSEKKWTEKRYNKKIHDLAKVISAIDKKNLPDIVGLVEVENRKVIESLAANKQLKKAEYKIVHEESPDIRGIDVALMYKKGSFKYISHKTLSVNFDFEQSTKTRDILYVKGKMNDTEILHVFVNHWSSRREGTEQTEPKRICAANVVKKEINNILHKNANAKIILIGDFNDEPQNNSLSKVLNAGNSKEPENDKQLYNLLYNKDLSDLGTYNYRGNWLMLDNIIVSSSLLKSQKNYVVESDEANIFSEKWMLFYNKKYDYTTPNRTYGGSKYYGGISDHLPVYVRFKIKK